jgi:hypothetical protein
LSSAWWRVWARCGPAHVSLDGGGSILMIGCGTHVTEVVRRGMMCDLCVPCGVADERSHAAVCRQPERARGVRAGVVGWWCRDQPSYGELCKVHGTALRGLDGKSTAEVYGGMRFCMRGCPGTLGWHAVGGFGPEVGTSGFTAIFGPFCILLCMRCHPGPWVDTLCHLLQSKPSRCCSGPSLLWR